MAWRLGAGLLAMVAGLTPAGAQLAAGFYLPMDRGGGGPVVWYGPGCREPLPFQRESTARAEDGGLLSDHQPRYVPGKLGEAIVYEGGDYWMHHRGTTNWLPAALALVDDSGLWEAVGAAQLEPTTAGLVGDGALRATLRAGGVAAARVRSTPFTLAHPAEFHLASVYVRGAQAKGVRLAVLDPGLRFAAQSEPLDPGADWQRLFVRFQLPKDARPKDLRLVLTAAEGAVVEFDGAMVEQAATHYHDRRSPSSWIPGMVSRALEKSTIEVWPETLDPARGTLALWVRPLDQVTNSTLLAIGAGWTTPWRLSRDTRGEGLAEVGAAKLRLGPLPAEAWTHLAVVWEADLCRAYRNGRQVAETKCPAADLPTVEAMTAGAFRVGVGHDDLGQFARSIGANAALDEVWLSGEAWPAERVLLAATQPELLPRPALPALDTSAVRRAVGREESVKLPLRVHGSLAQLEVRLDDQSLLSIPRPPAERPIEVPLRPGTWPAGRHELRLTLLTAAGAQTVRRALWIGPARAWDRFQVVGWNVDPGRYGEFRELGGTVVNSAPDHQAAVLATAAGMYGMWSYTNRAAPPPGAPDEWWVTQPDGSRGAVNLAHPQVRAAGLARAAADAARTLDHPHLKLLLLNTEWDAALDFGPAARHLAKQMTGLDLTLWPLAKGLLARYGPQEIEAAEAGTAEPPVAADLLKPFELLNPRYLPAELQPVNGVIEPDHPLYRFTLWWQRERALAAWNEQLAATFVKRNPALEPLFDPILRGPTVRRYANLAYGQEWVYVEQPLRMLPVQESLTAICRGTPMRPTGMPQFLFKAGTSAPISVTPPKDLMVEATWLACSRPIAMMTYWGWQLVFGPGDMWTEAKYRDYFANLTWDQAVAKVKAEPQAPHLWHPGGIAAMRELDATLFQPFGELIRRWDNEPRRLAVVKSLASEVFSTERWWTAYAFGPAVEAVSSTGLPYDVLYDEDLTSEQLGRYEAVLLTAVTVLPRPAQAALERYAAAGGLVLATPDYAARLRGATALERWTPEQLRTALAGRPRCLELLPAQAAAAVNALILDGARFVVVVNDRRQPGPLLGQWGKVAETGVPQEVALGVGQAAGCYELTKAQAVQPTAGRLTLDLPAAGGRIVGLYPQRFGGLEVRLRAEPGELALTITARDAAGAAFQGPVPVAVRLRRPDGSLDEHSRGQLVRHGALTREIPVPHHAPGRWQVEVTERLTGGTVTAEATAGS